MHPLLTYFWLSVQYHFYINDAIFETKKIMLKFSKDLTISKNYAVLITIQLNFL